jgi:hypothetical protein
MSARRRLPNRRASLTFELEHAGLHYTASFSRFETGEIAEVFISNHKRGNSVDVAVRDAGILISLLLQHGCALETIARTVTRDTNGSASGIVGAVLDRIARHD